MPQAATELRVREEVVGICGLEIHWMSDVIIDQFFYRGSG
jgi:hypothetical protein